MAILYKTEYFESISMKMGKQLESIIKHSTEIMQSLLVLNPPLVVDCSLIKPCKEDYVITQSALFYSYSGDLEAKKGHYAPIGSIRKEMLAPIWSHIASHVPSEENRTQKGSSSQERKHLSEKDGNNKAEKDNESTSLEMFSSSTIGKKPNIHYNKYRFISKMIYKKSKQDGDGILLNIFALNMSIQFYSQNRTTFTIKQFI